MSDANDNDNATGGGKDPKTGKFQPGNKAAKGNPYAKKMAAFKKALYASVTADDVRAIVKKAVEQAREGDRAAREFVFDRLIGKPVQTVEANIDANAALKTYLGIDIDAV